MFTDLEVMYVDHSISKEVIDIVWHILHDYNNV